MTAVLGILPQPFSMALYLLSPIFMAPAITRRVYGVVRAAEPGRLLLRYAAGFSASFVVFGFWVAFELPKEIAFLVPALLSIPAWIGVRRSLTIPDDLPEKGVFRFTKRYALGLAAAATVMFWIIIMGRMILTNVFSGGDETSIAARDALLTWIPPAFCFLLYGVISDRGHDRAGFICIMSLSLFGSIFALLPGIPQGAVAHDKRRDSQSVIYIGGNGKDPSTESDEKTSGVRPPGYSGMGERVGNENRIKS